jgi:hypothetical protein
LKSSESGQERFALALFVVAFALRLVVARNEAAEPVWDGHYYDFGARHIALGLGYADEISRGGKLEWHPWCHYPVGYSAFLALFYKIFGATRTIGHVANALVGALLANMTWLLGREAVSDRRAKVAGVLVALHPGLVLYGALTMTEPLSALLTLSAFWVVLRVARIERAGLLGGVFAGALLLGFAVLVRPQALLCAPFLAFPAVIGPYAVPHRKRQIAIAIVIACVGTLVPVLPWTARNCRVMDACSLVSTNAGWNLAIGAFPRATGRFETLRSDDGCTDVTGQVQQDRCWFAYGIQHIKEAPGRWLRLIPKKLAYTFDHESFPVEYLHQARPQRWPDERRTWWRGALTAVHRALVLAAPLAFVAFYTKSKHRGRTAQLALLGVYGGAAVAACTASTPVFWPLVVIACVLPALPVPGAPPRSAALLMAVALLATTVAAHAVFFGEDRYHVVVTPVLCLLAASMFRRSNVIAR